jgi:hypothetical protein
MITGILDMKRVGLLLMFGTLSLVVMPSVGGEALTNQPPSTTSGLRLEWGPPHHGLRLSVQPEKQQFLLGRPIKVLVVVTNLTNNPLNLPRFSPYSDTKFAVADVQGRRAAFTRRGKDLDGAPGAVSGVAPYLVPARGTIEDVFAIDDRFELSMTGTYFVTAKRLVGEGGRISPELVSNKAKFEIISRERNPSTPQQTNGISVIRGSKPSAE